MAGFFRECRDGVEVFVRLTPRAAKDAVEGLETTADGRSHLAARVRAVPEKGEANAALERLLAASLGIPKKSVSVVAGGTSRLKTVRIVGHPGDLAPGLALLAGRKA
ncbi:DUF167 family protein [Aminobacter aganoensis]|uniref:UPF0235 protein GGR00_003369 n=1 Tax=Aminobacter aganoensis TaxID=83264 RepID=A0A7X0F9I0_9HYPH|nr:DUF167 family protein [Aminobacter sp. DSM 101952]KQU73107.1 hypothetical protein ASC75_05455 [Aminobacter sp. DSM 101952]MBB6355565.1 hypothetical protein [Aminobacter aganoensis]